MTEIKQVYKCELCGNVVEVLHGAGGELVCCGAEMIFFEEKTADQGKEKHVPVFEATAEGLKVKVGANPHPMEEKHFIEWIEVIDGETSCRHYLQPGQAPEALFKGYSASVNVTAREYCNVHGLWKS